MEMLKVGEKIRGMDSKMWEVKEVSNTTLSREIEGQNITKDGSAEDPVCLVEDEDKNMQLLLKSELMKLKGDIEMKDSSEKRKADDVIDSADSSDMKKQKTDEPVAERKEMSAGELGDVSIVETKGGESSQDAIAAPMAGETATAPDFQQSQAVDDDKMKDSSMVKEKEKTSGRGARKANKAVA
eukprot:GILJ01007275.1.p1 GENE.GILJ01007275.1~~GILJ01007275.1.p1  ORF type:complete len:184 (-),score=61.82 GILJ01007275.1:202-753(-)